MNLKKHAFCLRKNRRPDELRRHRCERGATMRTQKRLALLNSAKSIISSSPSSSVPSLSSPSPSRELAGLISETIAKYGCGSLSPSVLVSRLDPCIAHFVFSDTKLKSDSLLSFFNWLNEHKPTLGHHPGIYCVLAYRLLKDNDRSSVAKRLLKSLASDLDCPFSVVESHTDDFPADSVLRKFFLVLFGVYSKAKMTKPAHQVFVYMKKQGWKIDASSCKSFLMALRASGEIEMALEFLQTVLDSGLEATPHYMAIIVDGLCSKGEIEKAAEFLDDMSARGFKPNIFSYNSLMEAHCKNGDLKRAFEVLDSMEDKLGVERNVATYTIMINALCNSGRIDKAEEFLDDMKKRGMIGDVYVYTSMVHGNCKSGNIKRAFALFDESINAGLTPNAHTYGALINGLCKLGQMKAASTILSEMQRKGIVSNQIILHTMIAVGIAR